MYVCMYMHTHSHYTVKTENCAVVLLCVLMDDTPTIDVMWIFFVRFSISVDFCVQKMQVCAEFFIVHARIA